MIYGKIYIGKKNKKLKKNIKGKLTTRIIKSKNFWNNYYWKKQINYYKKGRELLDKNY